MDHSTLLSIIIPVYNEENTIAEVIQRVWETPLQRAVAKEIIVVDDKSSDGTAACIESFINHHPEYNLIFIRRPKNGGKGAAIRDGIARATGQWIIIQDADREYNPADYNLLLQPALDGYADVVYGSRFVGGNPHRILFFWHSIGNKFLTFVSNAFTDLNLTDMETGYKLFRADILKNIELEEDRFGFEPEITAKIARIPGIRIYEVGISYYGRTYAEGKKIKAADGFRALYTIFKYNLQHMGPRRPFAGFLTLLLLFIVAYKTFFTYEDKKPDFLRNDAAEYYQYLPAVFIYNDPGFKFYDTLSQEVKDRMGVFKFPNGLGTGRMSIGLAIINLPGFWVAHLIAQTQGTADGYSLPYHWAILVTSFIFLGLGIYYTQKLLLRYFSPLITGITVILLVLATNILAYITLHPGMSHIVSFGLMAMLLFFTDAFYRKPNHTLVVKVALLMGIISLIRPSNALVGLLFLLWGCLSLQACKERAVFFVRNFSYILILAAGILLVWMPQLIYWKWVTGQFFFYTYGLKGEHFFFNNPQILNVLLSYRNGWLVYTPLMFFALAGFIFLWRDKNRHALAITVFFVTFLYVISSWWSWWYGGSFGGRSFIDIYPVMAIPLAAFIRKTGKTPGWARIILLIVAGLLIHLNYYQTWQYSKGIVHWAGMTREAYWYSLKNKIPQKDYYYLIWEADIKDAMRGIYFRHDFQPIMENQKQINKMLRPDRKEFIELLRNNIKASPGWWKQIKEKARQRGISEDSMLTLDAKYIFEVKYHNEVPDSVYIMR
ncbi:MAG: glycosyltransferase [Bacteroidales bacterium]